jgi:hypothetical protein
MTIFSDKVKTYNPRLMKDLAITSDQACGIWGNIGAETGGFKALQEIAPTVKGSRGGYGWMQWTGPRRKKFEAWCADKQVAPASDEANYEYLVKETLTDEVHSLVQLRKTTSVETATETFMKLNLRPGVTNLPARLNYAKQAALAVHEKSSAVRENTTVGAVVVGTAGTMAVTPHHHWPLIIIAGVMTLLIGAIAVTWYNSRKEQNIIKKGAN